MYLATRKNKTTFRLLYYIHCHSRTLSHWNGIINLGNWSTNHYYVMPDVYYLTYHQTKYFQIGVCIVKEINRLSCKMQSFYCNIIHTNVRKCVLKQNLRLKFILQLQWASALLDHLPYPIFYASFGTLIPTDWLWLFRKSIWKEY